MPSTGRDLWPWLVAGAGTGAAFYTCLAVRRYFVSCSAVASPLVAGIELGGTTCVAAVVRQDTPCTLAHRLDVATTTPAETLGAITAWLDAQGPLAAIGVASFGPVDLDVLSDTYGSITTTPKENWRNFALLDAFKPYARKNACAIAFDTDVNAPAMAELAHGNHR